MASKPGSFFHGSAWPTQIRSAPALASACTSAWPTADLPSVTSTLRNFGSQPISRSIGSSAIFGVSLSGKAISTAWPARSSRAPTLTRARRIGHVAMQMQHQRGAGIQPHQAQPPGQALAEEQVVAVAPAWSGSAARPRRSARATSARATGSGGRPRAAGTARRRSRRTTCSFEAAHRRAAAGHAQRDAAALRSGRQTWCSARAQDRVLALGAVISGMVIDAAAASDRDRAAATLRTHTRRAQDHAPVHKHRS